MDTATHHCLLFILLHFTNKKEDKVVFKYIYIYEENVSGCIASQYTVLLASNDYYSASPNKLCFCEFYVINLRFASVYFPPAGL